MGDYVQIQSGQAIIAREVQDKVLILWKHINHPEFDIFKRGGSWRGSDRTKVWYSWMDSDYDLTVNSCGDVLDMLGFDFTTLENGDISIYGYDNKKGQEDVFFTVAKFYLQGQLDWVGEDGDTFSWVFNEYNPDLELSPDVLSKVVRMLVDSISEDLDEPDVQALPRPN